MRNYALSWLPAVLALCVVAPTRADEVKEAWTPTATMLRAEAAGISLPQQIAGLALSKSGEASKGGEGVDNYAQYLSEDGAIQATVYVYLPSYADASLAAYMTDKAIAERFGSKTRRTAYGTVAAGGRPETAIRAIYDDAADGALSTGAAFIHAGRWLVKLRITGPTERREAVVAGLDGMISALRFDDAAALHRTKAASFAACPAGESATNARLSAEHAEGLAQISIQPDGQDVLCVRGQIQTAEGSYDMLQKAGADDSAVIVPVDDMGTVLAFDRPRSGQGYQLSIHSVGQTDLYGVYDRIPSAQQIAAILDGRDPQTAQAKSTAAYAASGEVTVRAGDARDR